jgi:hypothetical protein
MLYPVIFIIGFLLSGIWFAINMFLSVKLRNKKNLLMFSPMFSAIIPAIIIWLLMGDHPFHFEKLFADREFADFTCVLTAFTLLTTCALVFCESQSKGTENLSELTEMCMEAACMEIPQRAMMQTFILWLLLKWNLNPLACILINALVWCGDILFQAVIIQKHIAVKKLVFEILSSFLFSLGIGFVFHATKCIILPMVMHALERFITNYNRNES